MFKFFSEFGKLLQWFSLRDVQVKEQITEAGASDECKVTILDVLEVYICRQAILDLVHIRNLVRSERVSRRWQQVVLSYLQQCRSVTLYYTHIPDSTYPKFPFLCHRSVKSNTKNVRKTVEKLGLAVTRVITNNYVIYDLKIIASNCPHLEHLEICDSPASNDNTIKIFSYVHESERVRQERKDLAGTLIRLLVNDLTSLKVTTSRTFDYHIATQATCLGNLKSLLLHDFTGNMLNNLPLLLNRLQGLENIDLAHTMSEYTLSEELIECFGRLVCLKSITLRNIISNALLETVAQSCKDLNNLEIYYRVDVGLSFWRGIALLIKRRSHGIVWFFFDYDTTFESLNDLNKELHLNGYVSVTPEMLEAARGLAILMNQCKIRLELITQPLAIERNCQKLKIILQKTY